MAVRGRAGRRTLVFGSAALSVVLSGAVALLAWADVLPRGAEAEARLRELEQELTAVRNVDDRPLGAAREAELLGAQNAELRTLLPTSRTEAVEGLVDMACRLGAWDVRVESVEWTSSRLGGSPAGPATRSRGRVRLAARVGSRSPLDVAYGMSWVPRLNQVRSIEWEDLADPESAYVMEVDVVALERRQ